MGVFGWQLVRFSSPKFLLPPRVSPKVAGELLHCILFLVLLTATTSIVEFASQEDSQRAIRELSEQPLLGRPVFIREVFLICDYSVWVLILLTGP